MKYVKKKIRIGIPKTFFYYQYSTLYRKFFSCLGCDIVISGPTTDEVIKLGQSFIRNSCLNGAILFGHTFNLINKCDYIFLPNYSNYGIRKNVCSNIKKVNSFLKSTFINMKFLTFDVDYLKGRCEFLAFLKIGIKLRRGIFRSIYAYVCAKRKERMVNRNLINGQNKLLVHNNNKILIVGYPYVICDKYFVSDIVNCLKDNDFEILYSTFIDKKISSSYYLDVIPYLSNIYDKELLGSCSYLKNAVDGIIMIGTANCNIYKALEGANCSKLEIPMLRLVYPYNKSEIENFINIVKAKITNK